MNINPYRKCGEKWFAGHKCKQPRLKCLEVDEEGEHDEVDEEVTNEKIPECDRGEEQELVTLSLSSMVGLTAKRSMKMMGQIGGRQVIVLIDSGATSNFISERLMQ